MFFRTIASLLLLAVFAGGCAGEDAEHQSADAPATRAATFVGGQACRGCHADEAAQWARSHHSRAMQLADQETVLGDFNGADFTYNGVTSRFFRRGGEFWVNTDGASGELEDFRVTHTFGVEPLQQYLIAVPNGGYQALSIAWDTRPAERGGQRWFHLYPDDAIDSDDPLHWTGTFQSWNTMCAECHSTNLVKNHDLANDSFATTWSSINVDCEACHGPGSAHTESPLEFPLLLARTEPAWGFVPDANTARLQAGAQASAEVEICAQCHARRSQLTDDYLPGHEFLDGFRPALLDTDLYHADGQILDEVYVYGSFLQSAMYREGVVCSDCHEPHSMALRADSNALCGQCHMPGIFDTPQHHHHESDSTGAECVNCHMRAETYMVVDPRRDHSFRVPRPDLTTELGVPNACQDCHREQPLAWAAEQVRSWYPEGRGGQFHYAYALAAGRSWAADRSGLLRRVLEDPGIPEIVRATAVGLLADQPDDAALSLFERELNRDDPLVQLAALDALAGVALTERVRLAQRFLTHERLALRSSAARVLLPARELLSERRRMDLDRALEDYLATQRFNADRGEGLLNIGSVLASEGRLEEAEEAYLLAIEREPAFTATYVNLADLYRQSGREDDGQQALRDGLAESPDDPALSLALGLSLVRSGQLEDALELIERAASLGTEAPYYPYVFGVALNSVGKPERAIATLERAHLRFPGYPEILVGLSTMLRDAGDTGRALDYARRLLGVSPTDPTALALVAELEAADARDGLE